MVLFRSFTIISKQSHIKQACSLAIDQVKLYLDTWKQYAVSVVRTNLSEVMSLILALDKKFSAITSTINDFFEVLAAEMYIFCGAINAIIRTIRILRSTVIPRIGIFVLFRGKATSLGHL